MPDKLRHLPLVPSYHQPPPPQSEVHFQTFNHPPCVFTTWLFHTLNLLGGSTSLQTWPGIPKTKHRISVVLGRLVQIYRRHYLRQLSIQAARDRLYLSYLLSASWTQHQIQHWVHSLLRLQRAPRWLAGRKDKYKKGRKNSSIVSVPSLACVPFFFSALNLHSSCSMQELQTRAVVPGRVLAGSSLVLLCWGNRTKSQRDEKDDSTHVWARQVQPCL